MRQAPVTVRIPPRVLQQQLMTWELLLLRRRLQHQVACSFGVGAAHLLRRALCMCADAAAGIILCSACKGVGKVKEE